MNESTSGLHDEVTATAIFETVVAAWQPDWATWTSYRLRELQGAAPPARVLGWSTYFSDRDEAPSVAPAVVRITPLGDGARIQIGNDPTAVRPDLLLTVRDSLPSHR